MPFARILYVFPCLELTTLYGHESNYSTTVLNCGTQQHGHSSVHPQSQRTVHCAVNSALLFLRIPRASRIHSPALLGVCHRTNTPSLRRHALSYVKKKGKCETAYQGIYYAAFEEDERLVPFPYLFSWIHTPSPYSWGKKTTGTRRFGQNRNRHKLTTFTVRTLQIDRWQVPSYLCRRNCSNRHMSEKKEQHVRSTVSSKLVLSICAWYRGRWIRVLYGLMQKIKSVEEEDKIQSCTIFKEWVYQYLGNNEINSKVARSLPRGVCMS